MSFSKLSKGTFIFRCPVCREMKHENGREGYTVQAEKLPNYFTAIKTHFRKNHPDVPRERVEEMLMVYGVRLTNEP